MLVADLILLDVGLRVAFKLRFDVWVEWGELAQHYQTLWLTFSLLWLTIAMMNHVYGRKNLFNFRVYLKHSFNTFWLHFVLVALYLALDQRVSYSRLFILYAYFMLISAQVGFRLLISMAYAYYRAISYHFRNIVVVGSSEAASELLSFFQRQHAHVYHFLDDPGKFWEQRTYVRRFRERLEDLKRFCLANGVNEIYYATPVASPMLVQELSSFSEKHFIHFRIVSDISPIQRQVVSVASYGKIPIFSMRREPLQVLINYILKRSFDIAFSLFLIIGVFTWLFPIIMLLIKWESPGPVIFRQLRSGYKNEKFQVFKFRTMYLNKYSHTRQTSRNDPRITRIGAFLRKTSLDELPQFFNVLLGQMSVVGPRPHMLKQTEEYAHQINEYLFRHFIRPGITGYAQIHGLRGATLSAEEMRSRVMYDSWYIENWSFLLDMKIVAKTIWIVLRGDEKAY